MTEERLRALVKKRGGLKSAIVRINSTIVNFDKNSNTKHFLSVRRESLKSLSIKYDEVQSCLLYTSKYFACNNTVLLTDRDNQSVLSGVIVKKNKGDKNSTLGLDKVIYNHIYIIVIIIYVIQCCRPKRCE